MPTPSILTIVQVEATAPFTAPIPTPNAGPITLDLGDSEREDSFGHGLVDAVKVATVAQALFMFDKRD